MKTETFPMSDETFTPGDIRHYVKEFMGLHKDAIPYLSKSMMEALVDSWILRHIVIRWTTITQNEIRELHRKMYAKIWPED